MRTCAIDNHHGREHSIMLKWEGFFLNSITEEIFFPVVVFSVLIVYLFQNPKPNEENTENDVLFMRVIFALVSKLICV